MTHAATSSHPPSLMTVVERTLREECRLTEASNVLLAVSGGSDSMAMLHVMASLSARLGMTLSAHGVDHGLRSAAPLELDVAQSFAESLGVSFSRSKLEVSPGSNLQARARAARYQALRSRASELGANFIATAHHAEDRAETVLMRLLRGAGPQGIGVLPPRSHDLLRPLIRARKADIMGHIIRHQIQYSEDPSNADTRYLRTRVRHGLMKTLAAESPGIIEHLNSLADRMFEFSAGDHTKLPGLGRAQLEELQRLLSSPRDGREIALSGGWVLKLERRKIMCRSNGSVA
jgi:tRNA(Ile)-lysidine synthase